MNGLTTMGKMFPTGATMNKEQLLKRIRALVQEHGRQWQKIAGLLNAEKIPTLKGKSWTDQTVRVFYSRSIQDGDLVTNYLGIHSQEPTLPDSGEELPKEERPVLDSPSVPIDFPEWLDASALADLRAVLDWWRARQEESMILSPTKPMFRGSRRNSGFHINAELLRRATEKLKKDKVRTGGSMSLLMEILLWEYLGRPQDVLESVPQDQPDAWSLLHATPSEDYEG